MSEEQLQVTTLFAVRTTIGQEKSVANMIFGRLRLRDPVPDIKAILVAEQLRGYVFIEAIQQNDVQESISGIRHVKGKIVGSIKLTDLAHVITPRKVTEILEEGDIVEIVSGIFQNRRAVIERMPREGVAKEDVVVRLMDSDSPISIKVRGDYLKLLEKGAALAAGAEAEVAEVAGLAKAERAAAEASQGEPVTISEGSDLDIFATLEKEMGLAGAAGTPGSAPPEGEDLASADIGAGAEDGGEVGTVGFPEDDLLNAEAKVEKLERKRKESDSGKDLFFDEEDDDWTKFKEEEDEDSY